MGLSHDGSLKKYSFSQRFFSQLLFYEFHFHTVQPCPKPSFLHHSFHNYVFGIKVQNKTQNRTIVFLKSAFFYLSFSITFESILDKHHSETKKSHMRRLPLSSQKIRSISQLEHAQLVKTDQLLDIAKNSSPLL